MSNFILNTDKRPQVYIHALGGTIASIANQQMEEFYNRSSTDINELVAAIPLDREQLTIVCEEPQLNGAELV